MVSSKDNTPTIRASETRKDLIVRYATAATLLYGVISVSEFMNVFNHYEDDKINAGEIGLVLSGLAKTDDVEFSLHGDILSGPDFQPEFDDYADNVADIRRDQKGKPRYLPVKDEFLRYVDVGYREPEKPYAELKAYILKHGLSNRGVGLDGVDGDLIDLHEMIQSGVDTIEYLNYFTKRGYKYEGIDAVNSFMQMVMNAHNNTRLYNNNGFTPNEILEKFERPQLIPLPKEPLKLAKDKKIGVNRPCPCGSGKKYKKCCGRWD